MEPRSYFPRNCQTTTTFKIHAVDIVNIQRFKCSGWNISHQEHFNLFLSSILNERLYKLDRHWAILTNIQTWTFHPGRNDVIFSQIYLLFKAITTRKVYKSDRKFEEISICLRNSLQNWGFYLVDRFPVEIAKFQETTVWNPTCPKLRLIPNSLPGIRLMRETEANLAIHFI